MTDFRLRPAEAAGAFEVVGQAGGGSALLSGLGADDPLTAVAAVDAGEWVAEAVAETACVATEEARAGDAGTAMVGAFVATEAAHTETLTI